MYNSQTGQTIEHRGNQPSGQRSTMLRALNAAASAGVKRSITTRLRRKLPVRYAIPTDQIFREKVGMLLRPGIRILDVGSGCKPTIPTHERPEGCYYVGLDCSAEELQKAPPGSYDETVVADAVNFMPELSDRFDLVLSFQVFEHVKPLDDVLGNMYRYLRPGGGFVAQFSGTFAAFALLNIVTPERVRLWAIANLTGRPVESAFPAYFHHCYAGALSRMLSRWNNHEILPLYLGGWYFGFLPPVQAAYVAYEEWARRGRHANLATHYIVMATR